MYFLISIYFSFALCSVQIILTIFSNSYMSLSYYLRLIKKKCSLYFKRKENTEQSFTESSWLRLTMYLRF